ncbi:MAG: EscU/YscU/HrcU family type III secretion system export apparatus switch protein, partial [Phycisphaerales bacterium]
MAEDLGEKTEQPTGRRLSQARSKGQVPKSQDLSAAIMLIAAVVIFIAFGGNMVTTFGVMMQRLLEDETLGNPTHTTSIPSAIAWTAQRSVRLLVPIMVLVALVAYASNV